MRGETHARRYADPGGEDACAQSKGFFARARTFRENVTEN